MSTWEVDGAFTFSSFVLTKEEESNKEEKNNQRGISIFPLWTPLLKTTSQGGCGPPTGCTPRGFACRGAERFMIPACPAQLPGGGTKGTRSFVTPVRTLVEPKNRPHVTPMSILRCGRNTGKNRKNRPRVTPGVRGTGEHASCCERDFWEDSLWRLKRRYLFRARWR